MPLFVPPHGPGDFISTYFVTIRLFSWLMRFQYYLLEGLWCHLDLQKYHPYILACSYGVRNEKNTHGTVGITGKRKCRW